MRELDKRFPTFTHRFNLHFRSLALSNVPFDRLMSGAAQVYAQYGIEARFAYGQSLGLSPDEEARFSVVKQNCDWVMDSGEFADLHRLGAPIPNNDVAVFIVNQFQENIRGCGGARDQSAGLRRQPRLLAMELGARNLPRLIDVELCAATHRQHAQPHVSQRIPSLGTPRADRKANRENSLESSLPYYLNACLNRAAALAGQYSRPASRRRRDLKGSASRGCDNLPRSPLLGEDAVPSRQGALRRGVGRSGGGEVAEGISAPRRAQRVRRPGISPVE
jgi:hypothetical protein